LNIYWILILSYHIPLTRDVGLSVIKIVTTELTMSQSSEQGSQLHPTSSEIILPSASLLCPPSSSRPPPLPSVLPRYSGICSECGASVKIITSTGVLFRHGHGYGRLGCSDSGQPPLSVLPRPLDAAVDLFNVEPDPQSAESTSDFVFLPPGRATLKRIPRGARQKAALSLELRLRALLAAPMSLDNWRDLLQFASSLSQPQRGGKRNNLTTQIVSQIDRCGTPSSVIPQTIFSPIS